MSSRIQTFDSHHAREVMDDISGFLEDRRRATTLDVATHINMSPKQACAYLNHMMLVRRAECLQQPTNSNQGRTQTIWGPGDAIAGEVSTDRGYVRQVTVRAKWPPNHVRMQLECLLFGVPKILQGTHA